MSEEFAIYAEGGEKVAPIASDTLLVLLDETGHEKLRDPNYPVFGLGGCAVLGADYVGCVHAPWREMKEKHFGGADAPLHAAGLRPNDSQKEALGDFFRTQRFHRLAVMVSDKTVLHADSPPYGATSQALLRRILDVAFPDGRQIAGNAILVLEHSQRGNPLAKRHLPWAIEEALGYFLAEKTLYGPYRWPLPIQAAFMSKTANAQGLEVADFVMHAAGGQVQQPREEWRPNPRKDFAAVFQAQPELSQFMLLNAW